MPDTATAKKKRRPKRGYTKSGKPRKRCPPKTRYYPTVKKRRDVGRCRRKLKRTPKWWRKVYSAARKDGLKVDRGFMEYLLFQDKTRYRSFKKKYKV
jgi:hypothetical protein